MIVSRFFRLLSVAAAGLPLLLPAADRTWTGAGADLRWTTPANWGGTAPAANDALRFDGSAGLANTNDFAADTAFAGLTFLPAASGFSLSGNRVKLTGNIVNQSPAPQTVNLPLVIDAAADRSFDATNGPLVFASSLTYTNLGTTARSYKKSGTNDLLITGTTLVTNLYSRFALDEGTLRFAPGSRFDLVDTSNERNILRIGNVANKKSALIVETNAAVALGGLTLQMNGVTGGTGTFDLLVDGGTLALTGTDNTFGDQTGNRATVVIDHGGLLTNTSASSVLSFGTRIPASFTIEDGRAVLGMLSFGRGSTSGVRLGGRSDVTIKKGQLTILTKLYSNTTSDPARTNVLTLGDGRIGLAKLATPNISRPDSNGRVIYQFNGGTLECLNSDTSDFLGSPNEINLLAGGLTVDTLANTVKFSNTASGIVRDPALPLSTRDGGLCKRGSGTLEIAYDACQFNGPLRVEDGTLRISSAMLSDLEEITVAPGKTLSFRGSYRQQLVPGRLTLGDASTASRLDLDAASDGSACDTLRIPAGGYVGKLNLHLKQRGPTDVDLTTPGDYPVFTYATEPPDLALLTHANRAFGVVSTFLVDRANKTVILRLALSGTESTWANSAGGDWETAANWTPASPAGTAESRARFWGAIAAPATVSLATATRIGGVSFNNSQMYTLAGTGVLSIGDQSGGGYLTVDAGSHALDLPLALLAPITMNVPASQTLALNGAVSGAGGIVKGNPGSLLLTNTNTFAGGVQVNAGTLSIAAPDALGTGPLTLAGGTASITASTPFTLANTLQILSGSTLDTGAASVDYAGVLDWTGNGTLVKQGAGELRLSGSCDESATNRLFNFRQGTTRLLSGAAFSLRGNNRDILQTTYSANGQTSALIVESGATLSAGGMRLLTGGAVGTSTVHVAGGTLNLLDAECTVVNVGGGRADILVSNGGKLNAVSGFFSLGVNGLGTLAVTNAAAVVARLTVAGYADAVGGGNRNGTAQITVEDGGTLEVREYLTWITDNKGQTVWLRLDGGRLILPATARSTGSTGTARLILDGGTLQCSGLASYASATAPATTLADYLYGVNELQLGADGVTVDTGINAVTITQPLTMEAGSPTAAGFTKTGAGRLTLSGANTFDAPVTVAAGTLALSTLPSNHVAIASGAKLAFSPNSATTELVASADFAAGSTLAVDYELWNGLDRLSVSGSLSLLAPVNIELGDVPDGTFTLFTYGSLTGSASSLRVANPKSYLTYTFTDTGSAIQLTVGRNAAYYWTVPSATSTWSVASHWSPVGIPNAPGDFAGFHFGSLAPSPFISLTSPITVGVLSFDAERDVTLLGSALTLDSGTFSTPPLVQNDMSSNVIGSDLILNSESLANITAGTSLTLSGDVSGLGSLAVEGGGTLVLAGTNTVARTKVTGGSTLTLGVLSAQQTPLELDGATLSAAGSASSGADILFGAFGATAAPATDATLTLSGTLSGDGGIVKSGSSMLALSGTLAYRGTTALTGGTLALATPPPAGLTLGAGTFAYTGADANLPGYTLNVGASPVAAVLDSDANLTVTGAVASVAGGFVKRGSGTLSFTFPGSQQLGLGNSSAAQDAPLNIGANGDAPTQGFNPFSVAAGQVVLGAPGQVNTFAGNLVVGHYTSTAAAGETAAHLSITGGTSTVAGHLAVGRGNGNTVTAPVPLESSVTVSAGAVSAASFSLGHNGGNTSGFNARPAVAVNGGTVTVGQINLAEHLGSVASFTVNGGTVTVTDLVRVGHQTSSGGGGTGILTVNGGSLTLPNDINLGVTATATGTLHLAGGLTSARNVVVGSGTGTVRFDGGTLRVTSGPLTGVQALVLAGGAVVHVPSGRYTVGVPLLAGEAGDGGLTTTGPGMLALDNASPHTYTGPTVVSEGVLALRGSAASLPAATSLTVSPGASFHASSEIAFSTHAVAVADLTLGSDAPAADDAGLALWLNAGNQCDQLVVAGSLSLGHVAVYAYQAGSLDPALYNGVYPLLAYAGSDPDISGLTVANPNPARGYAFSIDAANKRVLLTITDSGSVAADAVWVKDGDGDWSADVNWQNNVAPDSLTAPVTFGGVITQPRTVNVDVPATVGGVAFNSTNRYTLSGSGTLTLSGAAPAITAQAGNHTVSAPLAVAAAARVALAPAGNTLTLAGPVSGDGAALALATAGTVQLSNSVVATALAVDTGTLELTGNASVSGALRYNAGQITATGNASLDGAVELPPGSRTVRANSGATLTVNGAVLGQGQFVKDAGGTVVLAAANAYSGGTRIVAGTLAFSGSGTPGTGPLTLEGGTLGSTGSAPVSFANPIGLTNNPTVSANAPLTTSGTVTMPAPRSVTKEGTNVWSVSAPLAGGGTNDAYRLFLRNGTVRFDSGSSWCLASTNGSSRNQFDATAFEAGRALGWVIETNSAVTLGSLGVQFGSINPGTFSLVLNGGRLALTAPDNPLGLGDNSNLVISVTVNAGEWRTVSDAAWCDLGTRCPVLWTQNGGLVSFGRPAFGRMNGSGSGRLNGSVDMALNDGTFEAREFFSWKSTDDPAATNRLTLGCGVPLQGRFSVPATTRYHNGGRVIMNLNGGVLEARGLCSPDSNLNGSLNDYLYGVNDLNVLAGGANFDTLTNAVSIRQPLTPDAAGDGGLTKLGSGRLALEADVALTGLVTVAEGTLDAAFTATPDLRVAAAGTLDLSQAAAPCAFRVVSGTGQATNGTLAVTGTLSPGEAEDEAGTLHAQSLALQSGATLRYDWSATTNDLFDVSGELAAQSAGFIDFGREEGDDLPLPFTAVIGRYGTFTGTFSGWKSINTGLPARTALASVIKAENGVVTLSLSYSGLMILIR